MANNILENRNIELIRSEGFRIIRGSIPRDIRNALHAAVKAGLLGRVKKEHLKPEVFYHPDYEQQAMEERLAIALRGIAAIAKVCVAA